MIMNARERERRRTGREPVEAVGHVHRVGDRVDDEDDPDEQAELAEVDVERPRERQVRVGLHEVHREPRERRRRSTTMPNVLPRLRSPRFRRARTPR